MLRRHLIRWVPSFLVLALRLAGDGLRYEVSEHRQGSVL